MCYDLMVPRIKKWLHNGNEYNYSANEYNYYSNECGYAAMGSQCISLFGEALVMFPLDSAPLNYFTTLTGL